MNVRVDSRLKVDILKVIIFSSFSFYLNLYKVENSKIIKLLNKICNILYLW